MRVVQAGGSGVQGHHDGSEDAHYRRLISSIDLLLTDVVLPGRSGRLLADDAAEIRPGLKVLFTTGYSTKPPTSLSARSRRPISVSKACCWTKLYAFIGSP